MPIVMRREVAMRGRPHIHEAPRGGGAGCGGVQAEIQEENAGNILPQTPHIKRKSVRENSNILVLQDRKSQPGGNLERGRLNVIMTRSMQDGVARFPNMVTGF